MNCIYLSPVGDDKASGALDAPIRTLEEAAKRVDELAAVNWNGPTDVVLRGGVYPLEKPVTLSLRAPVTLRAYPNETPVLDGAERLENAAESQWHGLRLWTCPVPKGFYFRSLFAGDERRERAALPKSGYYWMEDVPDITLSAQLGEGSNRFVAAKGDVASFKNLTDAEIHAFHYWTDEHMPIESFDEDTRLVTCTHTSIFALKDDNEPRFAKYRVENILEGLSEPGEWYLDRAEGTLLYLPKDGETLENTPLYAPRVDTLLTLSACRDVRVDGLTFLHTDWTIAQGMQAGFKDLCKQTTLYASSPQAASHLPGALNLLGCERCAVENCEIAHVGYYAIDIRESKNLRVVGNVIRDMGAGGVKINGATADGPVEKRSAYIRVTDNDIGFGGRVFLSGIGVCSMHANHVTISHNHIHDLYYSGVSCGWIWGYRESVSHHNAIEYNHIHALGFGVLSDMGGIYTLGEQPGTVETHNLIHDIEKANYGGWAIYPDEGSSHIVIENNVSYNTSSSVFHQHYGRENTVRNNVWAFGREGMVAYSRDEGHIGYTFERNIVLTKDQPIHVGGYSNKIMQGNIKTDMNLYWDVTGAPIRDADKFGDPATTVTLDEARKIGYDLHSVIADPKFADPEHGDFTLAADSPALALGFQPIDLSGVGVRPFGDRD